MKVRCVTTSRGDAEFAKLSLEPKRGMVGDFVGSVTIGAEYVVYGIRAEAPAEDWKEGPRVLVRHLSSLAVELPLSLFEITDPRVSRYWNVFVQSNGGITLMPPSLHKWIKDLSPLTEEAEADVVNEGVRIMDALQALLEAESADEQP